MQRASRRQARPRSGVTEVVSLASQRGTGCVAAGAQLQFGFAS